MESRVYADRGVMKLRPDIVIRNKKRENVRIDGCGNTSGQECHAKGSGK